VYDGRLKTNSLIKLMSVTSRFVQAFDAGTEAHVKWLAKMIDLAENFGQKMDLVAEINLNPMNVELDRKDALEWPHIHFCLCAVYAKAVLRGKAWTPQKNIN
jgi:hypothetical protein